MVTTADNVAVVFRGAPLTELNVNVTIAASMIETIRDLMLNSPLRLTRGLKTPPAHGVLGVLGDQRRATDGQSIPCGGRPWRQTTRVTKPIFDSESPNGPTRFAPWISTV